MSKRYCAADARRDVGRKSASQIERESAEKWTLLAIAAFRRYASGEGKHFLLDGETYRQEALEHAAQVGDDGRLLRALRKRIAEVRPRIGR